MSFLHTFYFTPLVCLCVMHMCDPFLLWWDTPWCVDRRLSILDILYVLRGKSVFLYVSMQIQWIYNLRIIFVRFVQGSYKMVDDWGGAYNFLMGAHTMNFITRKQSANSQAPPYMCIDSYFFCTLFDDETGRNTAVCTKTKYCKAFFNII